LAKGKEGAERGQKLERKFQWIAKTLSPSASAEVNPRLLPVLLFMGWTALLKNLPLE